MSTLRPAGTLIFTSHDRFATMAAFYRDVLALPVRSDRDGFINFDFGGQRLTVAVHSELSGPARDAKRVMVNFATDDIESDVARLVAAGVRLIRHAERERWGGTVATFPDPDGNILQLMQFPLDVPQA